MIEFEKILPPKRYGNSLDEAYNAGRLECLIQLKVAESRGEICKPLSVEEIQKIQHDVIMCKGLSCKYCGVDRIRISRASHMIHNAMVGKERV